MADEAVTFESAREKERKEVEEAGEEPFFAGETPVVPDAEDLEEEAKELLSILRASPDELTKTGREVRETIEEQKTIFSSRIESRSNRIAVTLENIQEAIDDADSNADFLEIIAETGILIAQNLGLMSDIQLRLLESNFDILGAVEPFTRITVSGNNEIEDADTAELVVPQSDQTSIPTRILFMRASEDNTDEIAIGDDDTEPDSGYVLDNGDSMVLNIDLRQETLWMASGTAGQSIELLGLA